MAKPPPDIPSNLAGPAEKVLESAMAAFEDAGQIRLAIETLKAYQGHKTSIVQRAENDRTFFVLECIWRSLWWHLLTLVSRAYADPRNDDLHAKVAFKLLEDPATRHAAVTWARGNNVVLDEATNLWAQCEANSKLKSVIMIRHKQVSHWTNYKLGSSPPTPDDIFAVSLMTAEVLEKLAHGVGVSKPPFYAVDYRDQAERFWTTFVS